MTYLPTSEEMDRRVTEAVDKAHRVNPNLTQQEEREIIANIYLDVMFEFSENDEELLDFVRDTLDNLEL